MEHDDTPADYLRRIEFILDESYKMLLKAAINAEEIRKNQEVFMDAQSKKLSDLHDAIKTIGWWACFAVLLLAAIKWHWGG